VRASRHQQQPDEPKAVPIPFLIYSVPTWESVAAAKGFLGVNRAFAWTMTTKNQVDVPRAEQRRFATGLTSLPGTRQRPGASCILGTAEPGDAGHLIAVPSLTVRN